MNRTNIEWVKNPDGSSGMSWNPITGCLNGCEYCYARKLANGRLRSRYLANLNTAPVANPNSFQQANDALNDPFYPRFWPERLNDKDLNRLVMPVNDSVIDKYAEGKKAKGIFVCDMSDLFGIGVPEEWTRNILYIIRCTPQHRFYLLTKQPQNLIKWSPFPDNCWVGVSATHAGQFMDALTAFIDVEAKVKYISFEPLLEQISHPVNIEYSLTNIGGVKWVIIGAQTKPYKPPKIEWVQWLVQACDKAGIPVFLKDNLKPLYRTEMPYDDEIFLRQELPR